MTLPKTSPAAALAFLEREIPLRVGRYFPELSPRRSLAIARDGEPRSRRHSLLFEFTVLDSLSGIRRGLFVKIPKSGDPASARANYETLVELHRLSLRLPADSNVVRPLDYFPELCAWATERIDGEELARLLRRPGARARAAALVKSCGRFMRRLHEARSRGEARESYAPVFLNECRTHLARLELNEVDEAKTKRIRESFERGAERLACPVPICHTPKDFNVRNIIVRGDRLFLIEATEPRMTAVYDDLAAFLNSLVMLFWHTPWMFAGVQPSPSLATAFMDGYFRGSAPLDKICLFCAKHLCLRWNGALESLSSERAEGSPWLRWVPLRAMIDRFFYRRMIAYFRIARSLGVAAPRRDALVEIGKVL